ncbi:LysR family transcriptional regulator [Sphingopyxis sp. EG6]|nr:LysR family transcriptional regulator [Sphingopyxis sp. EG6]
MLRDELQATDFRVTSDFSPAIGAAVQRGEIDLGFSRIEPQPNVVYKVIDYEPTVSVAPGFYWGLARLNVPLAARASGRSRKAAPARQPAAPRP